MDNIIEVLVVSDENGHRVVVTAAGKEIHRTIVYDDADFANMHAIALGRYIIGLAAARNKH